MSKAWEAVILVKAPGGGQSWNGTSYQNNTMSRNTVVVVPDAGGYFNTKALLEGSFGIGSVQRLTEKNM